MLNVETLVACFGGGVASSSLLFWIHCGEWLKHKKKLRIVAVANICCHKFVVPKHFSCISYIVPIYIYIYENDSHRIKYTHFECLYFYRLFFFLSFYRRLPRAYTSRHLIHLHTHLLFGARCFDSVEVAWVFLCLSLLPALLHLARIHDFGTTYTFISLLSSSFNAHKIVFNDGLMEHFSKWIYFYMNACRIRAWWMVCVCVVISAKLILFFFPSSLSQNSLSSSLRFSREVGAFLCTIISFLAE